ncbi:gliding motility lipoprotein GldH [Sungkyunkwania multivorans]|uniref:Gliding motility lipoprotein GldH n=1 Tax=Sungkyunkwania multivorans TaxID=1173618 RepID=A0ABW3CZF3_9FLAO
MNRTFLWMAIAILFISCDGKQVYDEYHSFSDGWDAKEQVSFKFEQPVESDRYDLFVNLRNDNSFPFSNIFLIIEMNFPEGKVITDTLEYEMARPDGEWLGKGFTDVKENKLWYKENITFPEEGDYSVTIKHAMRKNGDVSGIEKLPGILDIGFRIEKK